MADNSLLDLLDGTVDQLADMPVFKPVPSGSYDGQFSHSIEEGSNGIPYIKFEWKLKSLIEAASPIAEEDMPDFSKEGGVRVVINAFPRTKDKDGKIKVNEFGEGLIKQIVQSLQDAFPGEKNGEILRNADGASVAVTFGVEKRKDKETGEIRENSKFITQVVQ